MKVFLYFIHCIISLIHATFLIWYFTLTVKFVFHSQPLWAKITLPVVIWLCIILICNGCPLTYLEQWLEIKRGKREVIDYKFTQSLAYQYFFRFLLIRKS